MVRSIYCIWEASGSMGDYGRELADQDHDGNLTCEEFTLCMYLINAKLHNRITAIPTSLTPELTIRAPPPIPKQPAAPPPLPAHSSTASHGPPAIPTRSLPHSRNASGSITSMGGYSASHSPALPLRGSPSPQLPARPFPNVPLFPVLIYDYSNDIGHG